jgi:hypothetical protein
MGVSVVVQGGSMVVRRWLGGDPRSSTVVQGGTTMVWGWLGDGSRGGSVVVRGCLGDGLEWLGCSSRVAQRWSEMPQ